MNLNLDGSHVVMQEQIKTNETVLGMEVFNGRLITGNCKGRISEHLFQATRRRLFLTANFSKEMLLEKIKPGLTPAQYEFLDVWWYSIDGFEFVDHIPHLYEIKSRQL